MDKKTWIIDEVNKKWGHNKGALHTTQHLPTSVKGKTTAYTNFTTFSGTYNLSNPEDKRATIPIKTYKDTCRLQMILHGMWYVF